MAPAAHRVSCATSCPGLVMLYVQCKRHWLSACLVGSSLSSPTHCLYDLGLRFLNFEMENKSSTYSGGESCRFGRKYEAFFTLPACGKCSINTIMHVIIIPAMNAQSGFMSTCSFHQRSLQKEKKEEKGGKMNINFPTNIKCGGGLVGGGPRCSCRHFQKMVSF